MSRVCTVALPLALVACSPDTPSRDKGVDIAAAATAAQGAVDAYGANAAADGMVETAEPDAAAGNTPSPPQNPLDPPAPGTPGGLPDDHIPISEAPFTPDSAQGAANVVQSYYALIGAGNYTQAFALRAPGSAGADTAFAAGFSRYSEYHANVGAPGPIDAGAGQRYVTVPVQVYARLKRGGVPVYRLGNVVLHRTGDVDGATAEQRTWHIRSIDLKTTPDKSGDK